MHSDRLPDIYQSQQLDGNSLFPLLTETSFLPVGLALTWANKEAVCAVYYYSYRSLQLYNMMY